MHMRIDHCLDFKKKSLNEICLCKATMSLQKPWYGFVYRCLYELFGSYQFWLTGLSMDEQKPLRLHWNVLIWRSTKVLWVWNDMRVNTWWKN